MTQIEVSYKMSWKIWLLETLTQNRQPPGTSKSLHFIYREREKPPIPKFNNNTDVKHCRAIVLLTIITNANPTRGCFFSTTSFPFLPLFKRALQLGWMAAKKSGTPILTLAVPIGTGLTQHTFCYAHWAEFSIGKLRVQCMHSCEYITRLQWNLHKVGLSFFSPYFSLPFLFLGNVVLCTTEVDLNIIGIRLKVKEIKSFLHVNPKYMCKPKPWSCTTNVWRKYSKSPNLNEIPKLSQKSKLLNCWIKKNYLQITEYLVISSLTINDQSLNISSHLYYKASLQHGKPSKQRKSLFWC